MRLYKFKNINASSIRTIMVADCLDSTPDATPSTSSCCHGSSATSSESGAAEGGVEGAEGDSQDAPSTSSNEGMESRGSRQPPVKIRLLSKECTIKYNSDYHKAQSSSQSCDESVTVQGEGVVPECSSSSSRLTDNDDEKRYSIVKSLQHYDSDSDDSDHEMSTHYECKRNERALRKTHLNDTDSSAQNSPSSLPREEEVEEDEDSDDGVRPEIVALYDNRRKQTARRANVDDDNENWGYEAQPQCYPAEQFQELQPKHGNPKYLNPFRQTATPMRHDDEQRDKYLVFTMGMKTYTPHQIGIKRIKWEEAKEKLHERTPGLYIISLAFLETVRLST